MNVILSGSENLMDCEISKKHWKIVQEVPNYCRIFCVGGVACMGFDRLMRPNSFVERVEEVQVEF